MTVGELIEILEQFDSDMEVVIGMRQRYGSDFMHEVLNVEEREVVSFYGDDDAPCIVITEGEQLGTVCYDEVDDGDDYY